MTQLAAKKCFETAGLKPSDVNVIELHDCFSANELITYEAIGLCPEGESNGPMVPCYAEISKNKKKKQVQCFYI